VALLTQAVQWVWGASIAAQFIVFLLLFVRPRFRTIPLFTAYVILNLCQAAFLIFLYSRPEIGREFKESAAWESELLTLIAQAVATIEILGITLKPYRGIWALGWRSLAVVSTAVLVIVALVAAGEPPDTWVFDLNRGYHLTFATAVIVCLLLIRYYSIPVAKAYKLILCGFCLFSCSTILTGVLMQSRFHARDSTYEPVWQLATLASFIAVQMIWIAALGRPVLADERPPSPSQRPPDPGYQMLSPEVNEQLRLLNERLMRLWKMEARSR
jgi:hypothetical protein